MQGRVTVLGTGIVGICTGLALLERGFQVEFIDRAPPASGASHGNAGVVSPWSCVPQSLPGLWRHVPKWLIDPEGPVSVGWTHLPRFLPWAYRFFAAGKAEGLNRIGDAMNALNRPNVDLYRHFLRDTGGENLIKDSWYVHVYRDPADADLSHLGWRMRSDRGVPMERIGESELREVEPAIGPAYKAAILIKDQARATDPGAVGRALFDKACGNGATFHSAEVTGITPDGSGNWMLRTAAEPLSADTLIVAAGAWSLKLLKPLGISVPLEAERGYHLVIKNPGVSVRNSIMDAGKKFVASSMDAGIRCAGTAEFAGLHAPPDYRRARIFKKHAAELFPDIDTSQTEEWMGTRPSLPDSLPCLGPVPGYENLFAAFGHSHYGFGMAPNTGRVIASLVAGERPNIDMTPYAVERFA